MNISCLCDRFATVGMVRRTMCAGGIMIATFLVSCGGADSDGPPFKDPPSYASFAGTWRGTLVEATSGSFGEVVLTLQQSGATLSGVWNARFNSGTTDGGTIQGAVLGNATTADFRLTSGGGCPLAVTVSLQTGQAKGTYASVNCPVLMAGSVQVYQDGGPTPYNPALPARPTGVVAIAGDGQVTLRWSKTYGASAHNVYWSTSPAVTTRTGTLEQQISNPATITGLASGTPYYFIVTAVNAAGEGLASGPAVVAMPFLTAPNAPAGVTVQATSGQARVAWQTVSGASGYNLYWSTTPGQAFSSGTKVTGATSGYVVSGLTNGTTYFVAVTATNGAGEGAPSAEAQATPYQSNAYDFDDHTLQGWMSIGSWGVVCGTPNSGAFHSAECSSKSSLAIEGHANNSETYIVSPTIDLTGSASPVLTFWHRYILEDGYDFGRVEVSTDMGASWVTLRTYTGTDVSWPPVTISLQGYSASSVLIRFRVTTDGSIQSDGWYIDDIVISR